MSLLLALVTFVMVVISLFMVLLILMQRAKSDGGVGAALGGGMAESAFGGETANVLTKATQVCVVLFFVLAFGLYLGRLHQHRAALSSPESTLPAIEAPALPPIDAGTPPAAPGTTTPMDPAAPAETMPAPSDSAPATTPPAAPGDDASSTPPATENTPATEPATP